MTTAADARRRRTIAVNLAVVVASSVLFFAVAEVLLRVAGIRDPVDRYYVWPPHYSLTSHPDPKVFPGVYGPAVIHVDSLGLRGDESRAEDDVRILTIGGSTTENMFLDQPETWQALLETRLEAAWPDRQVWIANAGRSGLTTRENLLQAQHLLEQVQGVNAVVFLIGINDIGMRLRMGDGYDPDAMQHPEVFRAVMDRAFARYPDRDIPWYKRTAMFQGVRGLYRSFVHPDVIDDSGQVYERWRELRRAARKLETLPDLSASLAEYERNIETIIETVRSHGVRPIFLTQPTTWKPGLSDDIARLAISGHGTSDSEYYSIEALARGMELYNRRLLEICDRRGVDCLDIASRLPKDTTVFFDDCHYNENGARLFAEVLATYFVERPDLAVAATPPRAARP